MTDIITTDIIELINKRDVELLEKYCLTQKQVECPVYHRFGPGIYIREVHIPAGAFAIGHHQKYEHVNIMLKGKVTMLNLDGSTLELSAPYFYIGQPGRKMGYIHEDIVWQNIYATEERNIEKLEAYYLDKSELWIKSKELQDKINWLSHEEDREDYISMLLETEFTEDIARKQTENIDDQIDIPMGNYKVKLANSPISGKGLFATAPIETNEIIAPARINNMRTFAGRYANHSKNPNAKMTNNNGDIELIAIMNIKGCCGGNDGEEITIDYRQSITLIKEILCQQ